MSYRREVGITMDKNTIDLPPSAPIVAIRRYFKLSQEVPGKLKYLDL